MTSIVRSAPAGPGAILDVVLQQWRIACLDGEGANAPPFRTAEAGAFVRSVVASLDSWDSRALEVAATGWAGSIHSLPVMGARLASLRRVLEEHTEPEQRGQLEEVLSTVGAIATQAALIELENAALTDSLTGAGNRRALETAAAVALAESARTGQPMSIAVIDLDGLKTINDSRGHSAGDAALESLAEGVRAAFRATDQLFRIGGDEFVVLFPLATGEAVVDVMARARRLGAARFSWGCATAPADGTDLDSLLKLADSRLYAKRRAARYQDTRAVAAAGARAEALAGALAGAGALQAAPGALSAGGVSATPASRHFGKAALVAMTSAAVVAILAFLIAGGGRPPHVNNLPPGRAPNSTVPGGGGAGSGSAGPGGGASSGSGGPGNTGTSGTGVAPGSGSPGPGAGGSGLSGPDGSGGGSGDTTNGGTTVPTTPPVTVPTTPPVTVPTTPTSTPIITVPVTTPGATNGGSQLGGGTTSSGSGSGSGGLLGGLGGTVGNTINNVGSLLP